MNSESKEQNLDFIRSIIKADQLNGKNNGKVHTRFLQNQNGYLHLGQQRVSA